MINNTDSIYPRPVPLEYPVAGEKPSVCKVGVINISDGKTTWMKIPGEPDQNYIIRAEFIPSSGELLINQLNRHQNRSRLFVCNTKTGNPKLISEETDEAWLDVEFTRNPYAIDFTNDYTWFDNGKSILWISEKNGWRHLYRISLEDGTETSITSGDYDIIEFKGVDQKGGRVYLQLHPAMSLRNICSAQVWMAREISNCLALRPLREHMNIQYHLTEDLPPIHFPTTSQCRLRS